MTPSTNDTADPPGLAARRIAADVLDAVLRRRHALDGELEGGALDSLDERDRALVRKLVATAIRRAGTLRHLLEPMLERGLPKGAPQVESALLTGATQILFMDVPDHAAVDLSVRLVQADRRAARYARLVNGVLRRIAREGRGRLAELDAPMLDTPPWLMRRWIARYGEANARAIAAMHAQEPALDLTVKHDPQGWADRLGGRVLPTGTVRLAAHGPVPKLEGFEAGAWWVQDAAAAIPARLFGDLAGKAAADLCAAPGGKTAQLALAGARVTAIDRSERRLSRLRENLDRLGLDADVIAADATAYEGGPFDAILLDAPCSSTGTIRRHPDIAWLKSEADLAPLTALQARLLDRAAALLGPGGTLVYCTCSLEPEEGEHAVAALLARNPALRRAPVAPGEIGGTAEMLTPEGELRTLPCHWPDPDPRMAGIDGFFAARLVKA